jgi:hypothetical protein
MLPPNGTRWQNGLLRRARMKHLTFAPLALLLLAQVVSTSACVRRANGVRAASPAAASVGTIRVDARPGRALRSFVPDRDVGTSIDALPSGVVDKVYSERILRESLSAGWGPISYRQNTELRIAAWHWNPSGRWSDEAHKSGYFTGSAAPGDPIRHSYGYGLPHRGTTRNEGTDAGFSRMTDGDARSYWKSHPYLAARFTGERQDNPQWVVVDVGGSQPISAMRIDWGAPYALAYQVQYWTGEDPMRDPAGGEWKTFPQGRVDASRGGTVTLTLAAAPQPARFVRLWMTASSGTCGPHGADDPRNCVGYAIREVYAGSVARDGSFVDVLHHAPDQSQSSTYCSSIDPWHGESDLHAHGEEVDQTGLDLFYTSGITNRLPAIVPVTLLYGTPEDSAAQIAYLRKRGYPISYVEMGEEPDGQYMTPEDYAALYLQWATAIHRVAPDIKLGGPSFTGVNEDVRAWPDEQGRTSWLGRFLAYLGARRRLAEFAFLSFEHYPYEACKIAWSDLYREPELVAHILQVWREDGLPPGVPMLITESNLAPDLTHTMVDIFAALWLADNVGAFFANGGSAFYHSPIQPEPLDNACDGMSTYGNFVADADFRIRGYTSQYFASRLINLEWLQKGAGVHEMYPSTSDVRDASGHALVTSYAVRRPDGDWSLLLVNRDASNAHDVRVTFDGSGDDARGTGTFAKPARVVTFGSEQYAWQAEGSTPGPRPDGPCVASALQGDIVTLPRASVTVVRGKMADVRVGASR